MHVHIVVFDWSSAVAGQALIIIKCFVVVLIMMIIMMVDIQGDSMDGVTGLVVMVMGMGRRGRNEAIACEGKRQAEANEAPERRHVRILAKKDFASMKMQGYPENVAAEIVFHMAGHRVTPNCPLLMHPLWGTTARISGEKRPPAP